jgi:hypothetical protein
MSLLFGLLRCSSRFVALHLLRGSAQPVPSSTALADHRRVSSAAAAPTATLPAHLQRWTRSASDTIVTSARPLAPSDASHDGIAKVNAMFVGRIRSLL